MSFSKLKEDIKTLYSKAGTEVTASEPVFSTSGDIPDSVQSREVIMDAVKSLGYTFSPAEFQVILALLVIIIW